MILWLTGLSGSGKTTIAEALSDALADENIGSLVLDGDRVRETISSDLGYSLEDIRRVAHIAKLLNDHGMIVICCFISPTREIRAMAMEIISDESFYVVHVDCSLEMCRARDVKGLYANEPKDFTGVSSPYEPPRNPFLTLDTEELNVDECVELIIKKIM